MKVTGFDKLSRNLAEAQKALAALDGELGTVSFDPHDPGSIDAAIQEVERLVDERLGSHAANPIIGPMIDGMKERYRQGILDRAAGARLEGDQA